MKKKSNTTPIFARRVTGTPRELTVFRCGARTHAHMYITHVCTHARIRRAFSSGFVSPCVPTREERSLSSGALLSRRATRDRSSCRALDSLAHVTTSLNQLLFFTALGQLNISPR